MNMQPDPSSRIPLFSPPTIPKGLAVLVTLLAFTHLSALLMNQPASYWMDAQYGWMELPFSILLRAGPWIFLGGSLIYLFCIGLLLSKLQSAAGFFLSVVLALLHSFGLYRTVRCGFFPLFEAHSTYACNAYRDIPLILFFILFALFLLVDRLPEGLFHWAKRISLPLVTIWILLMGYGVFQAAFPPASPWKPLAPKHSPGPRTMPAIAYDSKRQRAVLFGGVTQWNGKAWVYDNSTWEWDGQDWYQMDTPIAPTGRAHHAMAYDEQRGRVVLYGGENASGALTDLWEWDGTTWYRLCPVCNPAARLGHKMLFNVEQNKIIVYGGWNGQVSFTEAWTWDGENWEFFPFESSAPALYNNPIAYNPKTGQATSFMGGEWSGTWIWEEKVWRKLDPTIQPPVRDEAIFIYDPDLDLSVLFGGMSISKTVYSDTWILKAETWEQLDLPDAPTQRHRAAAFYDPIRNSIVLYGGETYGSIYSDMWEFVLSGGNQP